MNVLATGKEFYKDQECDTHSLVYSYHEVEALNVVTSLWFTAIIQVFAGSSMNDLFSFIFSFRDTDITLLTTPIVLHVKNPAPKGFNRCVI